MPRCTVPLTVGTLRTRVNLGAMDLEMVPGWVTRGPQQDIIFVFVDQCFFFFFGEVFSPFVAFVRFSKQSLAKNRLETISPKARSVGELGWRKTVSLFSLTSIHVPFSYECK